MSDRPTTEDLMAYADGELSPLERARIEKLAASDPEIESEIALYRASRARFAKAFDAPLGDEIPDALRAVVEQAETPARPAAEETVLPTGPRRAPSAAPRPWRRPEPAEFFRMAASIVVIVLAGAIGYGVGVGVLGSNEPGVSLAGLVADGSREAEALSSPVAEIRAGDALRPRVSFIAGDGRACREFDIADGGAAATGVACRAEEGWRVEILRAAPMTADNGIRIASGETGAEIESVLDQLGAGRILDATAEACAARAGWRDLATRCPEG
jgi:hypothetical protein